MLSNPALSAVKLVVFSVPMGQLIFETESKNGQLGLGLRKHCSREGSMSKEVLVTEEG